MVVVVMVVHVVIIDVVNVVEYTEQVALGVNVVIDVVGVIVFDVGQLCVVNEIQSCVQSLCACVNVVVVQKVSFAYHEDERDVVL